MSSEHFLANFNLMFHGASDVTKILSEVMSKGLSMKANVIFGGQNPRFARTQKLQLVE